MHENIYEFRYWNYGYYKDKINKIDYHGNYFMLSSNLSEKEAFDILSYLFKSIKFKVANNSRDPKNIITTINILDDNLKHYGFNSPINNTNCDKNNIINLFIIDDKYNFFNLNHNYVKWYNQNISFKKVLNIFNKYDLEYKNIDDIIIKENYFHRLLRKIKRIA